MSFGENLREVRKRALLTQKEAARRMMLTQSAYSCYELEKREPDFDTLRDMCRLFGCSADYLLGLPTPPDDPVLIAYRNAPPVLQRAVCDMLHVAPPSAPTSSTSTFGQGGVYERAGK